MSRNDDFSVTQIPPRGEYRCLSGQASPTRDFPAKIYCTVRLSLPYEAAFHGRHVEYQPIAGTGPALSHFAPGMQPAAENSGRGIGRGGTCVPSSGAAWSEAWHRLALQLAASLHAIMQRRYAELQIRDALNRRSDYAEACKELASIIRGAYTRLPKVVQAAIYEDVLVAFRLLPGLDTCKQLSAANALLQAVESALPKQRRNTASSEYKHAAVAQNRLSKGQQQELGGVSKLRWLRRMVSCLDDFSLQDRRLEYTPLPHDVLVHVFGFLDSSGLAAAGAVCRSWRVACREDTLWQPMYLSVFGRSDRENCSPLKTDTGGRTGYCEQELTKHGSWRGAFESARKARPYCMFLSNRAYCISCNCLLWMSGPPWRKESRRTCNRRAGYHEHSRLRPMTPEQVLKYIVKERNSSSSSGSSCDSDTDEERDDEERHRFFRLWAHPKLGDDSCQ